MWKPPSTSPLCTAPLGQCFFFGRETNQGTSHQCQSWKGQSLVSSKAILHKKGRWEEGPLTWEPLREA